MGVEIEELDQPSNSLGVVRKYIYDFVKGGVQEAMQCGTHHMTRITWKNKKVIWNSCFNSTLKTTKIKILAAPVDREKSSLELGAVEFINFSELWTLLSFLLSRDMIKSRHESLPYGVNIIIRTKNLFMPAFDPVRRAVLIAQCNQMTFSLGRGSAKPQCTAFDYKRWMER